ncbi:Hpt domain-containing protein [Pareuzebyella sediminis]|uniref:Hpt domain-containing protein n=1 Tax=Pareuzebyella sediminis TaxID=2607998 RepID=UPI0011EDB3B1|nr:Hpt domain-containing protein [Pareuzebyella sediminis]
MGITKDYIEERPGLAYVKQIAGERDFDFQRKFVAILTAEFKGEMGEYLYHVRIDEPRAAAEIVDRMKYKFSVLGMEKAFAFAERHKEKLQLGDMSDDSDFKIILETISVFLRAI